MIYLDHNATTPPLPEVLDAMRQAEAEAWANPASVHRLGQRARAHLDRARAAVGALVGLQPRDVVLTSGGTEANNLALWHPFVDGPQGRGLVLSRIEHPSVTQTARALAERGVLVRWVEPEPDGRASLAGFAAAIEELGERLALVALMAVHHETGVVQPVAELAERVHRAGALLHVDAVQALGKLDPDSWQGADSVALAAHKLGGPKGIGALACRPAIKLRPVLRGGSQERGIRPGTQSAALAAGLAVAAERATETPTAYRSVAAERDRLERGLVELAARVGSLAEQNGTAPRAPHVTNLSFRGWRGPELCAALDLEGLAVSSGSACSAGSSEPSPSITAIAGADRARSAVRCSLSWQTRPAEIDGALACFERALARGR